MEKVGIIGAMEVEVAFFKELMNSNGQKAKITEIAGLSFFEGKLNNLNVVVVKSGVGKVNAALCAQALIYKFNVSKIINTGIAGAMAHGLGVLDIVFSTEAVYHDMDATGFGYKPTEIPQMQTSCFQADKMMLDAAQKAFHSIPEAEGHKAFAGRIASGDQFISDRKIKNHIQQICNPACVEMEGAAIAHACFVNGIPFLIIRCMSDMADDGHESVYSFNEETAAKLSASLVLATLKEISCQ